MADEAFDKLLTALRDEMRDRVLADLEGDKLRAALGVQSTEVLALQIKLTNKDREATDANLKFERYDTLWKAAKAVLESFESGTAPDLPALRAAVKASTRDCDEIPF